MQASRTTLFKRGGDNVAQPNDITMSSIPTHATSTWTSKVTSFLSTNHNTPPLDGILHKPRPLYIDRCHTMSMDAKRDAEEAQKAKLSKVFAWKRRRKRQVKERATGAAGPSGPNSQTIRHCETVRPKSRQTTRRGHGITRWVPDVTPQKLDPKFSGVFSHPKNFFSYLKIILDRKSTRLNSSHSGESRMPSSA